MGAIQAHGRSRYIFMIGDQRLFRLSRALTNTTLDEALEELALEEGLETEAEDQEDLEGSGKVCERMLEDLRLARSSAENSIKGGIEHVAHPKLSR